MDSKLVIKINVNKCKVLSVGRAVDKSNIYSIIENNEPVPLQYFIVASLKIWVF